MEVPGRDIISLLFETEEGAKEFRETTIEPRLAEEASGTREERLRLAIETVGLGIYERDLMTDELTIDAQFRAIVGLPEGPLDPDTARRLVHPEDWEPLMATLARAVDPNLREVVNTEFRLVWPDGQVRWAVARGRAIFENSGPEARPMKLIGVLEDITGRKQVEKARQEAEQRLVAFAEASYEGMAITENGCYVDANEQLAGMLGYTREELIGRPLTDFIAPEDRERVLANIEAERESWTEKVMVRKDGSRLIADSFGKTVSLGNRQVRFTSIRDITARKQAEEDLRQANQALQQGMEERTAKVREMAAELEYMSYCIMHDLRAPLRSMSCYAELVLEEDNERLGESSRDHLQRIVASSHRMDQLLKDALDYNRAVRCNLPLGPVDAKALLQGVLEIYPQFQSPQVVIRLEGAFPKVIGNEAALTQCFSHLLDNAVKFVRPGMLPKVRVWAEVREVERQSVGSSERGGVKASGSAAAELGRDLPSTLHAPDAAYVRIWFEDNGIGIPKEYQERIFHMFQQVETGHGGTGIGLTMVRKLTERMSGRAGVESEEGQGSRFWLELPLAEDK